ncbi:protein TIC 100 isoform X2 [Canna indica]|uniref:Protein TIC 100 isoform X2 n=1 Tax=Canna indica TaxID=4628 RepID=A0AAQ3QJY7_9LILI|nr:protein TIC 100 isoform X2 [Canna indica]
MADEPATEQQERDDSAGDSPSASSSDYDSENSSDDYDDGGYDSADDESEDDDSPETNFRRFAEALDSNREGEEEDDRDILYPEDLFDFPRDPEKWREEDLRELWADAPVEMTKPGWDPVWADEDDWEVVREEVNAGRDPPIAPFYLPYRKFYPVIPDNHHDIANPKAVIEELDRIEEFLKWVSYVFEDGSSYEGTVWDDLAHGKGVYVAEEGLVRYEGEWLQNQMEGHGVVEVEIPGVEPVPGSKLEAKMRAEGRIISRDFMSPEDRKWLEMDIEDSLLLAGRMREIPFYERKEWIEIFGEKPEKGRYRYAGQWKHGRMHGCGVYEVNERIIYGRFYFGQHVEDSTGCDSDVSALHAGIAEVAAAKARMFVNKPDGMVREERGPYGDPQHPYFYDDDDVWMAPGFINQFYDVPDYWKTYVQEVDQEREMWLNSFYKAPLRLPMPSELEYWWSKDNNDTEFVLINKEPEPDPEDPSKLIYTEDPLIYHTPTGRIINYVEDEKYGVRLFWQPLVKKEEDVDPDKAKFLPLGYDEFYGRSAPVEVEKKGGLRGMIASVQNIVKPFFDRLEHWAEEKKKTSEIKLELIEKELELIEAEISLEEALEDLDMELKRKQEEEEKRAVAGKDQDGSFASAVKDEAVSDNDEEEDDDDVEVEPTSFGTVTQGKADNDTNPKDNKPGKSPFSSLSLSITSPALLAMVPTTLQESFLSWRSRCPSGPEQSIYTTRQCMSVEKRLYSVKFRRRINQIANLRAVQRRQTCIMKKGCSSLNSLACILSAHTVCHRQMDQTNQRSDGIDNLGILCLQIPVADALALT